MERHIHHGGWHFQTFPLLLATALGTRVAQNAKDPKLNEKDFSLEKDEVFSWPVDLPVTAEERIYVLIHGGWVRRPTAHLVLPLASAVRAPGTLISLTQHLLDDKQRPLRATVSVEICYTPPEPEVAENLQTREMSGDPLLEAVKRNIERLEQGLMEPLLLQGLLPDPSNFPDPVDDQQVHSSRTQTPVPSRRSNRNSPFRNVRNFMRFGKKRRPSTGSSTDEEGLGLLNEPGPSGLQSQKSVTDSEDEGAEVGEGGETSGEGEGEGEGEDPVHIATLEEALRVAEEGAAGNSPLRVSPRPQPPPAPNTPGHARNSPTDVLRKPIRNIHTMSQSHLRAQDYQVCVTILEARQLAGLNMDPVVCIQVGEEKKYTSVKESTNCPYYNEYFVFDFHIPPVVLFDKIITLSVLHSRSILRTGTAIGSFKVDLKTVYEAADHQFYHKWAVLMDSSDAAAGPKGYLKCDISVIGKGDLVKVPPKTEKDEDDIEANLLLPEGVPTERQRARYVVFVHKADGLPKMNLSIMANVKKALTGETKDLVDPFVRVSFAGLSGVTSVKRSSYNPVWNEQIVFTDMFPPLCQRIRIQLMDHDPVKPSVIGTHYVDLKAISNDGEKGFLPTFGPAWVYLYGSPREHTLLDQHSDLNAGLGEGVSYRARVMISIRTEVSESHEAVPYAVEVMPCAVPSEACCSVEESFLLFSTIFDATMIDKRLSEKPISFELSIGNHGNAIDGLNQSSRTSQDLCEVTTRVQSTMAPMKVLSHDRYHYYLPLWDNKPCVHVTSTWPDHRRRMFISNMIEKISDNVEEGLRLASEKHHEDEAVEALRSALSALNTACARFVQLRRAEILPAYGAVTELDRRRNELCLREIESIGAKSRHLKAIVTISSFKERFRAAHSLLTKIKFLVEDPQGALPDVVIWAVGGGRRLAYQRILARHLLYSPLAEEHGKLCGKPHTVVFLKLPGKKAAGAGGWAIPAKLNLYLWLGLTKEKIHVLDGLPGGYEQTREIRNIERQDLAPPNSIQYLESHTFQLRAYVYQARSLIGSDASGLSDPFARVIAGEYCRTTRVIDETLSPTWDQTLVCDDITLYGSLDQIKDDPFTITIEIFDQDQVGKSEFIGRAIAKPHVKTLNDNYMKPSLEWYEITRGLDHAGELLAAFELLQITRGPAGELLPPTGVPELPLSTDTNYLPVPDSIRPTLANYRIEVLFWGLRDLKRVHFLSVDKPRVDIECAGNILSSSVIQNAQKNPNFCSSVKIMDVELPEEELYRPPLTIRVVDCRSFGRFTLVGTHMINSIHKYIHHPVVRERVQDSNMSKKSNHKSLEQAADRFGYSFVETKVQKEDDQQEQSPLLFRELPFPNSYGTGFFSKKKLKIEEKKKGQGPDVDDEDESSHDWWTKYFASVDEVIEIGRIDKNAKNRKNDSFSAITDTEKCPDGEKRRRFKMMGTTVRVVSRLSPVCDKKRSLPSSALCQVFPNELEEQPLFNEFKDWLQTFELYRGKKTSEEVENDSRIVGAFKGAVKVYQWPLVKGVESIGFDPQYGFFQGMPSNDPLRVLVRVYVIKANDLHPMDLNGKADPYIVLQLGSKKISDKDNYISKQLNPVFGKCFEMEAAFPRDSILTVKVQDWDLVGSDDVIGESKIDLENRFYSKHRATCGISRTYEEQGYNRWRDSMKPTQILAKLCKDGKLEQPCYEPGRVRIGKTVFAMDENLHNTPGTSSSDDGARNRLWEERSALQVLHRWHETPRVGCYLVPEHIETRPLFNPDKPGIERGKIEMWVDMFPMDMPPPGPPIDISPRKPKTYELRVIVWNTDDVVLEDDAFFTGEKMSDIYVKGWLKGQEDCQSTDIHYRSLTGEGNFNWRFMYPFDYLVAEEKIVISKKESLFSWDETESKIPARLELQVWDADHFSADDFLGAITLDLNRFPRGAKSSKLCTLDMLKTDGSVPTVNIFKQKRVKGWWPFYVKKENDEIELTGKVEAEIQLLTKEEAEKNPAGLGRNEPDALDRPNRPDASFMWFLNPLKSIRYIIWHNYKWRVLKALLIIALSLLILVFFYALPGYSAKRFIGA